MRLVKLNQKFTRMDGIDRHILQVLQQDGSLSQRQLAERVNLSPNACWNRLQRLKRDGIVVGQTVRLDREKLELGLVVFVMVKTRHHSWEWLDRFRQHVTAIPEVVDFFRIGGEYDYLLKVVTRDMKSYDHVYQRLINGVELDAVTSHFAMETIEEQRPLPLNR